MVFHDWTQMTPRAVADALTNAQAKPGLLAGTPVTEIADGDGAVIITFSGSFAALPAYLVHYIAQIFAPAAYGADGILTRDGERFALTLTTYPDRPELPLVASVLEQQFRAIGVELTINSTNSSEIPAGHADGSLELALVARNFALIPNPIGTVLSDYAPSR